MAVKKAKEASFKRMDSAFATSQSAIQKVKNTDPLNGNEEQEQGNENVSIDPAHYLSKKEKKEWKRLSYTAKQRYIRQAERQLKRQKKRNGIAKTEPSSVQEKEKQAAKIGVTQDILFEVNIGNEESKSGFTPAEAAALAARMADFPHTALKGLMAIPPVSEFPGENCRYFAEMRNLFVDIKAKKYDNVSMECLSMGMSDDFTDAIAEGSTMVRIGTAIFGKRNYNI